jgi:hypothetical protein
MKEEQTVIADSPEDEVILGESVSDEERRIRVYDRNGDFIIEVPAKAKVTFSYFNPASAGYADRNQFGEGNVAKQTALRIYENGDKGNQLACFMGVLGFRDLRVKKTKLVQKVVVERRYANDGEGNEDWSGSQQHELTIGDEDKEIPF